MRSLVVVSLLLASGCSLGCAQSWGLGDRPPPPASPADSTLLSDPEIARLEALVERLEESLAGVNVELEEGEGSWAESEAEAVRSSLATQQELLERRLVLSVAIANLRAAIASRRQALEDADGGEPLPEVEPIPAEMDDVVRQATEQVRAARDRRDARGGHDEALAPRRSVPLLSLPSRHAEVVETDRKKDREAAAVVDPPPARADLERALVPHFDALADCVPKSAGVSRVIVRGRLTADGRLRELRVVEGVAIPAIVGCLTDRLEAIDVPMPEGAAASVVTFPLSFAGR